MVVINGSGARPAVRCTLGPSRNAQYDETHTKTQTSSYRCLCCAASAYAGRNRTGDSGASRTRSRPQARPGQANDALERLSSGTKDQAHPLTRVVPDTNTAFPRVPQRMHLSSHTRTRAIYASNTTKQPDLGHAWCAPSHVPEVLGVLQAAQAARAVICAALGHRGAHTPPLHLVTTE